MSVVKTVQAGNPIVHTRSVEVKDIQSEETHRIVADLVDTMRTEDLVGMAAPQIGEDVRIFVTEVRETEYRKEGTDLLRIFINPEIVKVSEKTSGGYEGCGSVASAQFFGPVNRPDEVTVSAYNKNGEKFEHTAYGLLARVIVVNSCYNVPMAEDTRAITWEAPEHHHTEKGSDWYWALGILAIAGAGASIVFENTLFAIVILLGASTVIIFSHRKPKMMEFAVTVRGVRIGNELFPYSTLESFYIDEENPSGPQLLVKSKKLLAPLIIIPIPEEYVDDIDDLMSPRLEGEHIEEPFSHKLLEFFGF